MALKIHIKKNCFSFIILTTGFFLISAFSNLRAQDTTSSLAFKKNRPDNRVYFYYHPDLSYQLWQQFNLRKEANTGNALAEHELGLRYILGEGFPADTVQAAYWIHKAAEQHLPGACYNYGILLNNGWGVQWNPFQAFKYFLIAARNNMPQAEYMIGISYTDNLIVERNWSEAYYWIKKSAEDGFKPAKETLANFIKNIPLSKIDTTIDVANRHDSSVYAQNNPPKSSSYSTHDPQLSNQSSISSSNNLVFIDFSTVTDSIKEIPNSLLLQDLLHEGNDSLASALHLTASKDTTFDFDSSAVNLLVKFAGNGSPEALTLLGRMYELGIYFPKDLIRASDYYIRAMKLDSPRSPFFLWKMVRKPNYFDELKKRVDQNDPRAMFVWYGLITSGFDAQITEADAFKLLEKSVSMNYMPAMNELGLDLYTGNYLKQNRNKAIEIWQLAKNLGSSEAGVRIAVAEIYGYLKTSDYQKPIQEITEAIDEGSVLAQATLAYCYENGIGLETSEPQAVRYFRLAAQRGSRFAYDELKQLYNAIRPRDKMFQIN